MDERQETKRRTEQTTKLYLRTRDRKHGPTSQGIRQGVSSFFINQQSIWGDASSRPACRPLTRQQQVCANADDRRKFKAALRASPRYRAIRSGCRRRRQGSSEIEMRWLPDRRIRVPGFGVRLSRNFRGKMLRMVFQNPLERAEEIEQSALTNQRTASLRA
jgi:hypothetical protein